MAGNYFPMVDAFPQIKALLETLPGAPIVTEQWQRTQVEHSTIVVKEITNTNTTTPGVDELSYQVDLFTLDGDSLRALCSGVDEALCNMGFRRTMKAPWDAETEGFRMTLRYGRRVDKRFHRLID